MKLKVCAVLCAVLLGALALPLPVLAGVTGTPHDMAVLLGDPDTGPCEYCHVPHRARGDRLWVNMPGGPETGWGSRPIAQLCYSCHDAIGGGVNASNTTQTAYSDLSHGYDAEAMPSQPDGTPAELAPLPYAQTGRIDCTTCHDPHSSTPPFLRAGSVDELCKSCHGRENTLGVGGENSFVVDEAAYSLHPTDMEYLDAAANGTTSLEVFPDLLQVPTASGAWNIGGHRVGWTSGAGLVSCQTCHAVHGGEDYDEGVLPGPPASYLLPVENFAGPAAALCQSCHRGGEPEEVVGILTDHPINSNDGDPVTVFPAGWPAGSGGEVTCSSCHDTHGGEPGTSLWRQGGNETEGWCYSCHPLLSLLPPYHHSNIHNDDEALFVSLLDCGDCHGKGAGWTAHNGFEGFKVDVAVDSSALCEACHSSENPMVLDAENYAILSGRPIDFSAAAYPAEHGRISGTDSHLVNESDDESIMNCDIKTTVWEASGGYSKYGPESEILCESCHGILKNAGLVLGTGDKERLTGGWKTNLLLEPYEDNDPGIAIENPDFVPGPTLSGLCRGCHRSSQEGGVSTFVHNPEAHTVIGYTYPQEVTPYGRQTNTVLTVPFDSSSDACPEVSTADQMLPPSGLGVPFAPGVFSYPAENMLDCDSCHRPHGADIDSADDGVHRIIEYTDPGRHGTTPCLECHDTDSQCGYMKP